MGGIGLGGAECRGRRQRCRCCRLCCFFVVFFFVCLFVCFFFIIRFALSAIVPILLLNNLIVIVIFCFLDRVSSSFGRSWPL